VAFASTNQNKFGEVQSILSLHGIEAVFARVELLEIQSDSLEVVAKEKVKSAFEKAHMPVIVEDDGLFIKSLNGFPGPYSSYVFKTLGNAGIIKLLDGLPDRSAAFTSMIAYYDGRNVVVFEGTVEGMIADRIAEGGWGFDPIFIPAGTDLPFSRLPNKNDYSHRRKALEKFASWFLAS
jgi:XTP/dITP diphosphohydrolase